MSYKATLNAMLIIPKVQVPFRNVHEMVLQDEVQWLVIPGTVFSKIAKVNTNSHLPINNCLLICFPLERGRRKSDEKDTRWKGCGSKYCKESP